MCSLIRINVMLAMHSICAYGISSSTGLSKSSHEPITAERLLEAAIDSKDASGSKVKEMGFDRFGVTKCAHSWFDVGPSGRFPYDTQSQSSDLTTHIHHGVFAIGDPKLPTEPPTDETCTELAQVKAACREQEKEDDTSSWGCRERHEPQQFFKVEDFDEDDWRACKKLDSGEAEEPKCVSDQFPKGIFCMYQPHDHILLVASRDTQINYDDGVVQDVKYGQVIVKAEDEFHVVDPDKLLSEYICCSDRTWPTDSKVGPGLTAKVKEIPGEHWPAKCPWADKHLTDEERAKLSTQAAEDQVKVPTVTLSGFPHKVDGTHRWLFDGDYTYHDLHSHNHPTFWKVNFKGEPGDQPFLYQCQSSKGKTQYWLGLMKHLKRIVNDNVCMGYVMFEEGTMPQPINQVFIGGEKEGEGRWASKEKGDPWVENIQVTMRYPEGAKDGTAPSQVEEETRQKTGLSRKTWLEILLSPFHHIWSWGKNRDEKKDNASAKDEDNKQMVDATPDQQIADVIGGASNSKSTGPVAAEELQAELAKIAHAPDGEAEASQSEAAAIPKSQALVGEAEASQSEAAATPKSQAPDGEAEASQSEAAATPKSQAPDGEAEASQSEAAATPKGQAPVGEAEASQSEAAATPNSQAPVGEAEASQSEAAATPKSKAPDGEAEASQSEAAAAPKSRAPDGEAEASQSEAAAVPKSQALDGEAEASQSEAAAAPKSQAPVGEAEASQSEAAATPKSQAPDGEAEGGQKESPTEEELAQMQKEASDKDALIKQARKLLVEATDSYQERINGGSESESPTGEQKAPADGEAKASQSQASAAPTSQAPVDESQSKAPGMVTNVVSVTKEVMMPQNAGVAEKTKEESPIEGAEQQAPVDVSQSKQESPSEKNAEGGDGAKKESQSEGEKQQATSDGKANAEAPAQEESSSEEDDHMESATQF